MTSDIDRILYLHRKYSIPQFNWTLDFRFKQDTYTTKETQELIEELNPLLTDQESKNKLTRLFQSDTINSAIAVSNNPERKSIILMTRVTSLGQFVNSLTHEILHVSRHIDKCDNNESLFTTLGNIAGDIINKLYEL